ncbi:MAG: hypothetical protein KME29_31315 [Calothrix sp. FI2-JRJ7]|jgi:hypothetical protein|nr:hypothetical protein [Calothrix sp. FI2-JRJ7]
MTLLKKYEQEVPPAVPTPESFDHKRLESHINDTHGEIQNISEVAKLLALLSAQTAANCILGYSGFLPTVAVIIPCLAPIHQSLTQIDNSMGVSIDNPKRFISGLLGAGITSANAGYSIYKGFEIENLKQGAITEVKAGEAIVHGKKPDINFSPIESMICLLVAAFAVFKLRNKK